METSPARDYNSPYGRTSCNLDEPTGTEACDEAKPGQILIGPRVLMAVEKDIAVEPIGDFSLKGIGRPLAAYNVLAPKTAN
jgi:hypothetical protein